MTDELKVAVERVTTRWRAPISMVELIGAFNFSTELLWRRSEPGSGARNGEPAERLRERPPHDSSSFALTIALQSPKRWFRW
jgi:hypothetical protein